MYIVCTQISNSVSLEHKAMASHLVRIAKIGVKTHSDKASKYQRIFDDEFFYNQTQFKLAVDIDIGKVIKGMFYVLNVLLAIFLSLETVMPITDVCDYFLFVRLDVGTVPAFQLQIINDEPTCESLWLCFDPNLMELRNRRGRYLRATKHLVETFFVVEQEFLFGENDEIHIQNEAVIDTNVDGVNDDAQNLLEVNMDEDNSSDDGTASTDSDELPVKIIDDLYAQLREVHRNKPFPINYTDEFIQHSDLRPKLTQYQLDGVRWMLNRERAVDHFPTEFVEVTRRWPDHEMNAKFFYNERTMILQVNENPDVLIPKGGILADAMGLGKTVEMLDLILLNQRTIDPNQYCEREMATAQSREIDEVVLRCLCPNKTLRNTVRCIRCCMYQHRVCVSQRDTIDAPDARYICPTCWQNEPPLESKTTFIVSPPSIKMQWRDEVCKHVNNDNFKVSTSTVDSSKKLADR